MVLQSSKLRRFLSRNATRQVAPERTGSCDVEAADRFALSPNQLHALLQTGWAEFRAIGALNGLCARLRTDSKVGLNVDEAKRDEIAASPIGRCAAHSSAPLPTTSRDLRPPHFSERQRVFGENRLPQPKQTSIWGLMWAAANNKLVFLLVASALASLVFGATQAAILDDTKSSDTGWVESATIIGAIFASIMATAANDYQKNHRFQQLNEQKEERWATAIRSGKNYSIPVADIVVGDLIRVEGGDIASTDGVLVEAFQIRCNESSLSGELKLVHKIPADRYHCDSSSNPFLFSGSVVSQGVGTYVVTAVGANSVKGRTAMSLRNDTTETPLQQKLGSLAKYIIIVSSFLGGLYFLALLTRWLVQLHTTNLYSSPHQKGEAFLDIFMLAVTAVIIAVPEGLSLAVSIALAFATTHMLKQNTLVRLLRSCEVMGNATTICFDKTGTLTMNEMSVASGVIGCTESFVSDSSMSSTAASDGHQPGSSGKVIPASELDAKLARTVRSLLRSSIAFNSTAFEREDVGTTVLVGSATETALVRFANQHLAMGSLAEERSNATVVELFPFDAERKYMATIIKMGEQYRMLVKGAAETVLEHCVESLECVDKGWNPHEELLSAPICIEKRTKLEAMAQAYSQHRLRTIAIAYRDLDSWPPIATLGCNDDPNDTYAHFEQVFRHQLTFVAIFALRDPLRPQALHAIHQCQKAGVFVRMLTGEHLTTAEAIAREAQIYTSGGIAMDGPTFRRLSPDQMDSVAPRLQVLARSSATDKANLVTSLKRLGETVAVTGDGTNDIFALKAADVGFSMGVSGTEVAKQASSIVLMNDNFNSIVNALTWGRSVSDATKKYCQFQFTLNITAAVITVISTLAGSLTSSVFDVTQLLWLNLVMDIIAAVSFSTDPPRPYLLRRRPEPRNSPLITNQMWKMILAQSICQLAIIFTLHYEGPSRFWTDASSEQIQTVVFTTYMFMQLFNQINCRRVDNGLDIFEGILSNPWFLAIQALTLAGQMIIVFKGNAAFGTEPLTGAQWGWCIVFGLSVLPIGAAARCIPDSWMIAIACPLKSLLIRPMRMFMLARRTGAAEQDNMPPPQSNFRARFGLTSHQISRILCRESRTDTTSTNFEIPMSNTAEFVSDLNTTTCDDPFDLVHAIATSKHSIGTVAVPGLHLHPDTKMDDPVLLPTPSTLMYRRDALPPSQDWDVMQYLGIYRRRQ